jgi:arylsulfatase
MPRPRRPASSDILGGVRIARSLAALALALACSRGAPPPPNLLLVTADTLRPDRLACYGGPETAGTGICSLALHGARFAWAFSTAPSTAPSIASILTSRHASQHGVGELADTRLDDGVETVAEVLAAAGYSTAAFVSNPVLQRPRNLGQGFEIYDDRMSARERNRPLRERDAAATTDAALAWARVVRAPWFLWVHYQDPHGPYEPPGALPPRDAPGAERLPLLADHSGFGGIPAYQQLPGARSPEAYARRYLDEVRHLDLHAARLVAGLDALGARPAVLFTADHGEAFGEDGYWFAHGHSLGLDQIRVPLLVRPSAPARPFVFPTAVSTLDVAPTLLRLVGLAAPAAFEGKPLPLSDTEPTDPARVLFAEHRRRLAALRGDRYFARDRDGFVAPEADPVSGGRWLPLPPRSARLAGDGAGLPPYEPAAGDGPVGSLSAALARFAARAPAAPAEPAPLSGAARDALRALGYLE